MENLNRKFIADEKGNIEEQKIESEGEKFGPKQEKLIGLKQDRDFEVGPEGDIEQKGSGEYKLDIK